MKKRQITETMALIGRFEKKNISIKISKIFQEIENGKSELLARNVALTELVGLGERKNAV